MIHTRDAWNLRRLLTGTAVEGESGAVAPEFRPLAAGMAALPIDGRQAAWDAFLSDRPDRAALIGALAAVDPSGPPPDQDDETDAGGSDDSRPEHDASEGPGGGVFLEPGRRVKATDRDNFGTVVADMGRRVMVRFVSLDGKEATSTLPKSILRNPDGSPLEGPAGADGWLPLKLGEMPSAPRFPVEVFPDPVARFARTVAVSIGCPAEFVGLPIMIVAGAAIGRSASLLLKPGYFASAALYGMNVGGPSSGKSPALDNAARPMWRIDEVMHDDYRARMAVYVEGMEAYADAKKGEKPPKPAKPALESAVLDDATVEATASHLALNPRGLLVVRDEGSAWVASLNQYKNGRGSDRQFWLSALFGKPVQVDRKGNPDLEPLRIKHPFLGLIGNVPPDMVGELSDHKGRADGFQERILFAYPDPPPRPYWNDEGIPDEVGAEWAEIIHRLRARPMDCSEGRSHPHVVHFTPPAHAAWVAWYNTHVDEVNEPDYDRSELAVEGKLCDFAGRFALILHLLELAADPTRGECEPLPPVTRAAVEGAVALWDYFRASHRRVRWHMEGGIGNPVAREVVAWIRRNRLDTFTIKDLTDNLRWLPTRPGEPDSALDWLEGRSIIRRSPEPKRPEGTRGRKPSPSYYVHPDLRGTSRNSRNEDGPAPEAEAHPFREYREGMEGDHDEDA